MNIFFSFFYQKKYLTYIKYTQEFKNQNKIILQIAASKLILFNLKKLLPEINNLFFMDFCYLENYLFYIAVQLKQINGTHRTRI